MAINALTTKLAHIILCLSVVVWELLVKDSNSGEER